MAIAEFEYKILNTIGILSDTPKGWKKALRVVSWNKGNPKFDIRDWNDDAGKVGKGITLTYEEVVMLKELLDGIDDIESCLDSTEDSKE